MPIYITGANKLKHLLLFVALFLQAGGNSINVPIQNASFETVIDLQQDSCGPWISNQLPSWQIQMLAPGNGAGAFQPANPNSCGLAVPIPDGSQVAYIQKSAISQDLGVTAQQGVYTLTAFVTNRYGVYPGKIEMSLLIGSSELCSTYGWALDKWTPITLICPAPGYLLQGNTDAMTVGGIGTGNLGISISNDQGWQILVDNVSLTFTPTN